MKNLLLLQFIERFINESEHGIVLLSFGSLIKTASIPKHKEQIIVNALSKLKQRVIWKFENSSDEGTIEGNILRVRWIPQYELLRECYIFYKILGFDIISLATFNDVRNRYLSVSIVRKQLPIIHTLHIHCCIGLPPLLGLSARR